MIVTSSPAHSKPSVSPLAAESGDHARYIVQCARLAQRYVSAECETPAGIAQFRGDLIALMKGSGQHPYRVLNDVRGCLSAMKGCGMRVSADFRDRVLDDPEMVALPILTAQSYGDVVKQWHQVENASHSALIRQHAPAMCRVLEAFERRGDDVDTQLLRETINSYSNVLPIKVLFALRNEPIRLPGVFRKYISAAAPEHIIETFEILRDHGHLADAVDIIKRHNVQWTSETFSRLPALAATCEQPEFIVSVYHNNKNLQDTANLPAAMQALIDNGRPELALSIWLGRREQLKESDSQVLPMMRALNGSGRSNLLVARQLADYIYGPAVSQPLRVAEYIAGAAASDAIKLAKDTYTAVNNTVSECRILTATAQRMEELNLPPKAFRFIPKGDLRWFCNLLAEKT